MSQASQEPARSRLSHRVRGLIGRIRPLGDLTVTVAAIFLVVLIASAILFPAVSPDAAYDQQLAFRNAPPSFIDSTSPFMLGADHLGRDVLARMLIAAQVSLTVSVAVVLIAAPFGGLLGVIAGYYRGSVDAVMMRIVDVSLSFPSLLLAVVVLYVFGSGVVTTVIVLAATRWPVFARVARAEVLRHREYDYVRAARAMGASDARIIGRELVPNLLPVIIALAVLNLPQVMLAEAGLSFLGLGVQAPDTSWGLMVAQASPYIRSAWWTVVFPGLAIATTTVAIGIAADSVISRDPVLQREIRPARSS